MSGSDSDDAYAAAGVDYRTMDPGKVRAQRAAAATAKLLNGKGLRELTESRGESAYVVDFGDHYVSSVTEALGTKNLVADAVRAITGRSHYEAIARDTVATILNDLATVGGEPVNLTAYWGAGSSEWFADGARLADLTDGWAAACHEAGCAWGGGETQVLVGAILPEAAVLGGSAVGRIAPKQHLLMGSRIQAGDRVVMLPATGIHANGLSLARKVASELPQGYATPVPDDPAGRCLGEVLLDPTPLYGKAVEVLQRGGIDLHYAVHVTGHGLRKLMRADNAWTYVMERLPAVNPVFRVLCHALSLRDEEAYGTFNMGSGYGLFVPPTDVERTLATLQGAGFSAIDAGHVEPGPKRVVLQSVGVTFEGDTLGIR